MGRSQRTAAKDTSVLDAVVPAVGKTAETVTELAGRAAGAARDAQRAAAPVLRSAAQGSAETLSHAAERAAGMLAEAAERLTQEGSDGLAKAVQQVTRKTQPRRWQRRLRRMAVAGGVVGAAYMVVTKTPVKARLSELIFGPPLDEEEPEPITLPVTEQASSDEKASEEPQSAAPAAEGEAPSASE